MHLTLFYIHVLGRQMKLKNICFFFSFLDSELAFHLSLIYLSEFYIFVDEY